MATRSVAFPLLSGGAALLGYAALVWLRAKPRELQAAPHASFDGVEPLVEQLERVPDAVALDANSGAVEYGNPPLSARASRIRALFLARLTEALSPYHQQLALAQGQR